MRRRLFDVLVSGVGALLTVVLVVAGILLLWGYNFTNNQVSSQLSAQQITFPTTDSAAFKALPSTDQQAMKPYAGQLTTNGAQARAGGDATCSQRAPAVIRKPLKNKGITPSPKSCRCTSPWPGPVNGPMPMQLAHQNTDDRTHSMVASVKHRR